MYAAQQKSTMGAAHLETQLTEAKVAVELAEERRRAGAKALEEAERARSAKG